MKTKKNNTVCIHIEKELITELTKLIYEEAVWQVQKDKDKTKRGTTYEAEHD